MTEDAMKRLVVLTVASVASIATAQAPRVRDSAGVRIIENGPRLTAPVVFQLADKPSFDVGGLQQDPADELTPRNGYPRAIRLSNGNIAVLDRTRVVFYDASGKRIKAAGREGRGPGEFVNTAAICATRGDTVLVGQEPLPLTKLSKNGEFISTTVLPAGMIAEDPMCFGDGTHVLMSRVAGGLNVPSVYRFTRIGPDGPMNTIADHQYPLFDMLVRITSAKATSGARMYFADGDRFEITAFDLTGRLAEIIRTGDPLVPITDAEKAKMQPTAFRAGSSPAELEDARRRAIASSRTKYWPTVGAMHVDAAGRIWVQDWTQGYDPTKPSGWAAFDQAGRLLGRLIIPGAKSKEMRWYVASFGKDEVIVFRTDDDGAAHYTAYPVLSVRR